MSKTHYVQSYQYNIHVFCYNTFTYLVYSVLNCAFLNNDVESLDVCSTSYITWFDVKCEHLTRLMMLCYVMLCYDVMLCYVMLYVMLCYMLCYVMSCYVMLQYCINNGHLGKLFLYK